jgi:hypothetical protein
MGMDKKPKNFPFFTLIIIYLCKQAGHRVDEILILQWAWPTAAVVVTTLKVVFARAVVIIQISRALDKDDVVRSTCYGVQALGSAKKETTGLKKEGK